MLVQVIAAALRRQLLVAIIAVVSVVVQNAVNGGLDREVATGCAGLTVVCLAPAAFASSAWSYRRAAIVFAALFTLLAVSAGVAGYFDLLPPAVAAWLVLIAPYRSGVITQTPDLPL